VIYRPNYKTKSINYGHLAPLTFRFEPGRFAVKTFLPTKNADEGENGRTAKTNGRRRRTDKEYNVQGTKQLVSETSRLNAERIESET